MAQTTGKQIRIGVVDYLNAWPLAWALMTERYDPTRFTPVYLSPARVADGLADGSLDVGLVPSVELLRIPELRPIPGLCVASEHEVRSVLLVCPGDIEAVEKVALDTNSRTSAVLVQILLSERYGVEPRLVDAEPDIDAMLELADAALVIGDPALKIDRDKYRCLDLAAEWRALTGHPFVFAVWAVRDDLAGDQELQDLQDLLTRSLDLGIVEIAAIESRAARTLGLDVATAHAYLSRHLHYRLGADEEQGLAEFLAKAKALDEVTK